ncbi:MAG: hypothetical protein H8E66_07970 [Planctomycetes bacterium]|nr:hypothetical protein [Planctomycetota bacterium]
MSNEKIREVAAEAVLARTTKRWNRIHPTGLLGKLFRPLFGSARVSAIFVVEYCTVDDSRVICDGDPLAAWCIDTHGIRSIEADDVDTGPVHGTIWHKQLVAFAVHADDGKVLVNEWDGPGDGRLVHYAVKSDDNGVTLKFRGGSVVMG